MLHHLLGIGNAIFAFSQFLDTEMETTSIHPHPQSPIYYILNATAADGHAKQGKSSYVYTIFPE